MSKKNNSKQDVVAVEAQPVVTETVQLVEDDGLTETGIVEAAPSALATTGDNDFDYGGDYTGDEVKIRPEDVIIPMLKIVQESSKIWKDRDVSTATFKLGDIYNSVTRETFDGNKGVLLVPIKCAPCVVVRLPSPVGTFITKVSAELSAKTGGDPDVIAAYKDNGPDKWKKLEGKKDGKKVQFNYVDEVHVGLLDPADGVTAVGPALIPFGGKNVFPRKTWFSNIASVYNQDGTRPPSYAFRTVLKTVFSPGDGGVDSYKFVAEPYGGSNWSQCRVPKAHKQTLDHCKDYSRLIDAGLLGKADYSDADDSEAAQENAAFVVEGKPVF